jgi:D-glycero-D-manno-heptose 1,7-bisphosphate phosphatase|tara:strand:+ start:1024 stop:1605 length:582 start_codon:yes stop_codon:yes gene_type:complete
MKKAVFLDRDGVINKAFIKDGKPTSPNSLDELEILPGVKESILKLKKLNFICLVVTNQPDVPRGKINKNNVIKINNFLKKKIELDDIFVCYHDDKDNCNCRKPKPGLLLQASKKWNVDFKKSFMIGDRWRDIQAGEEVGCKTIYLNYNYKDIKPKDPSFVTDTLLNAVYIIEKVQNRKFNNEKNRRHKSKNIF